MEIEIVYWRDKIGGEVSKESIDVEPYGFQLSPVAEWKIIKSNERKAVKRNEVCIIDVEPIDIPENSIVSTLPIMRHALGVVVDVFSPGKVRRVEESKKISQVIFLPIRDGEIGENELLGVLNINYVKIGTLSKISKMISEWAEKAKWVEDVGGIRMD
jgi:hypothetical protein